MTQKAQGTVIVCLIVLLALLSAPICPSYGESVLATMERSRHAADFTLAQLQWHSAIHVENEDELANLGFPGNGSQSNPYVIQDLNISAFGSSISMTKVSSHVLIRNCFLYSYGSPEGLAIHLSDVRNISIESCTIVGNRFGIRVSNVSAVRIIGNRIYDATGDEPFGMHPAYGLYMENSDLCTIAGNTVYANYVGMELDSSDNCSIAGNTVYGNDGPGLDLSGSSENNTVSENIFGWNSRPVAPLDNAFDRGFNNTWSGNFWSDYVPPGPYNVSGSAGSQDSDPNALVDTSPPVIDSPEMIYVAEGADVEIAWTTSDQFPLSYRILINDEPVIDGRTWTHSNVTFSLRDLSVGSFEVYLVVADAAGNVEAGSVPVAVLFIFLSDIGTNLVIMASIFSVLSVALVVYMIKRRP
ncbi:MAG: nitrous oxide reductase family maturation protein NosD [Candidatus Thorarchaeota archaeon]